MKIPIQIDINGEMCGYSCPFNTGYGFKASCSLFNEELETQGYFDSIDGYKRCHKCLQIKEDKE